jgi:predicted ester cyclase
MLIALDALVCEGDLVAKRWTFRGTHTGDYMGLPATGRQVVMAGITIYQVVGGQVRETWWNYDALGMMQQLGAIPAPAEHATARA